MNIPFAPASASLQATNFDPLFAGLVGVAGAIVILVVGLVVGFSIRFREGSKVKRHRVPSLLRREVEIGWTVATVLLSMFLFWWAGSVVTQELEPPSDSIPFHVEAKQWMWKTRSAEGVREINALHVPSGRPVVLYMASQDVIHSFFVPAFRIKHDVVPGRTSVVWFEATAPGVYHLYCAEYCGTDHAMMTGKIVVLEPADYARWLDSRLAGAGDDANANLAARGRELFISAGCAGCHSGDSSVRAPRLEGVYGRRVPLADGRFVKADAAYLRDSILQPSRDVVAGYTPVMPSFEGVLEEGEIQALVAYLRELVDVPETGR